MKKEMLINALAEEGWYCEEGFFPPEFCSELLNEAQKQNWTQAQVGKGAQKQEQLTIRNDSIVWIEETQAGEAAGAYLGHMNKLMSDMNRELYLGLREFECHFAHYKTSGFYKKHLDQHQGSHKRVVSAILYLNEPESGGELVIYKKENSDEIETRIKPKPGTFVCFLSNQIYHEVLPNTGERYSVTGWFRTL